MVFSLYEFSTVSMFLFVIMLIIFVCIFKGCLKGIGLIVHRFLQQVLVIPRPFLTLFLTVRFKAKRRSAEF